MKKILFILLLLLVLFMAFRGFFQEQKEDLATSPSPTITPTPTKIPEKTLSLKFENKEYLVSWFKISKDNKISLYPNFKDKTIFTKFTTQKECKFAINANFYDKNNNPLGLFIGENYNKTQKLESALFNGVFYHSENGKFQINDEFSDEKIKMAVQSGPMLFLNKNKLKLKIIDDRQARRMFVLVTPNNDVYFASAYDKDSELQGPYLQDLPEVIAEFASKAKIEIESALNLDGGSASAFFNGETMLQEISPVGGIFCVK